MPGVTLPRVFFSARGHTLDAAPPRGHGARQMPRRHPQSLLAFAGPLLAALVAPGCTTQRSVAASPSAAIRHAEDGAVSYAWGSTLLFSGVLGLAGSGLGVATAPEGSSKVPYLVSGAVSALLAGWGGGLLGSGRSSFRRGIESATQWEYAVMRAVPVTATSTPTPTVQSDFRGRR